MDALSVEEIPIGPQWQYEPKWDGFRCVLFRDGRRIDLQSKAGKPLNRYFPDIVDAVGELKANQFVLDGELVVPEGRLFSFDDLLQRIHPAASRVNQLAAETPALFIVFDILVDVDGAPLMEHPLAERRAALQAFAKKQFGKGRTFRLSPVSTTISAATGWLKKSGAVLDGIVAKRRDLPYRPGTRDGMQKIKNYRTADCVVGGFRYNEGKDVVGSLLLGLYDGKGLLNHVGFTSNIKAADKKALTKKLERLIAPPGFTGDAPGGPSRWSTERSPVASAQAQAGGRSRLRSFQRRSLSPWHQLATLAPRQSAATMYDGSAQTEERGLAEAFGHEPAPGQVGSVPFAAKTSPAR
jgi:ATP-dependent DNA ligase